MNLQTLVQLQSSLSRLEVSRELDLISFLLEWAESLPRVNSATCLLLSHDGLLFQHIWRQLDGKLSVSSEKRFAETSWVETLKNGEPSIDSQGPTLLSLKPLEPPYVDRVVLPLSSRDELLGGLILSSTDERSFADWDKELLTLLSQQLGERLRKDRRIRELEGQVTTWEQKNRFSPPLLSGVLQLSHATLAESETRLTSVLHNLDTMQVYGRRLLQLLKFCKDEIGIHAGAQSQEKVRSKADRARLHVIESDIDLLLSDCHDGLAKIRFFLNHLASLDGNSEVEEQVDLLELLQSLTSVVSASRLVRWEVQRNEHESPALFGRSSDLRQAFLLLYLSMEKQLSSQEEPATISIHMEEEEEEFSLVLRFPVESEEDEPFEFVLEGEEFVRRILEEHQASLQISVQEERCALRLVFPAMFDYNEDSSEHLQAGGVLELPAIPASFDMVSLAGGEHSAPSSHPHPTMQSSALMSGKLLLLSEDALYRRSLKRALSHQHEVFTTNQTSKALGLLDAHPDIDCILCDLHDQAMSSLELVEHLQQDAPHLLSKVALLVGRRLSGRAKQLALRLEPMSLPRNALYQALEEFLQERFGGF